MTVGSKKRECSTASNFARLQKALRFPAATAQTGTMGSARLFFAESMATRAGIPAGVTDCHIRQAVSG
jgi:hypothetical protein